MSRRMGSTPAQRGSLTGETCPDVFELDSGDFLVIGALGTADLGGWRYIADTVKAKVSALEGGVVVPRDCMLAAAKQIAGELLPDV